MWIRNDGLSNIALWTSVFPVTFFDVFELSFVSAAWIARIFFVFEYDFFVKHLDNGYRSDLCAWDWNVKCSNLSSTGRISHKTKALRGWQATKLLVRPEVSYDYVAQGKWRVDVGDEVTADGRPNGTGRLVGMIFSKDSTSQLLPDPTAWWSPLGDLRMWNPSLLSPLGGLLV